MEGAIPTIDTKSRSKAHRGGTDKGAAKKAAWYDCRVVQDLPGSRRAAHPYYRYLYYYYGIGPPWVLSPLVLERPCADRTDRKSVV
jgi:hypothetical protein